jgi:hypothetical protein
MRSPRGVAAALILLLGVALAFITAVVFGGNAENVLHLAMAATFFLFAFAVFDFKLPAWINWAACAATAALAAIFLLQGVSDLMHSASLQHLAYEVLGQRLEKLLGYAFLLWCAAMLFRDSAGSTKVVGIAALAAILAVETFGAIGAWKLVYLPLFVWLLLESRATRSGS